MTGRPADPGLDADLATLRETLNAFGIVTHNLQANRDIKLVRDSLAALDRVEAELARLREARDDLEEQVRLRDLNALDGASVARVIDARDAAEAECARLREERDALRESGQRWAVNVRHKEAECARLRQALAWYADETNYRYTLEDISRERNPPITDDRGHRAREALAGPDTPADSQPEETT